MDNIIFNYFGLDIEAGLFNGNEFWLRSLDMKKRSDPDYIFCNLANELVRMIRNYENLSLIGGSYHFAANLNEIFEEKMFLLPYIENFKKLTIHYKPIIHMPFGQDNLPLSGGFIKTLEKQIKICKMINCNCIVSHAPSTQSNINTQWVEELANSKIRRLLRNNRVTICFENIDYKGDYYENLAHLVEWRSELVRKFNELNNHIKFCFDFGHYQIFLQRDKLGNNSSQAVYKNKDHDFLKEDLFEKFIKNTKVFHIDTNDGTNDQHILPFSNKKSIRVKNEFSRKQFIKNSYQVVEWLKLIKKIESDTIERYWILEVEPPFNWEQVDDFFIKYLVNP